MNRNELLNMKRRLLALTLAGACTIGLTGCLKSNQNNDEETSVVNLEPERKNQFLSILDTKAIIIEPINYTFSIHGSSYQLFLDETGRYDIQVPMSDFIFFTNASPITAEEYVARFYGPDFPIEYLKSEEYTR